jgi:hypothetical protein
MKENSCEKKAFWRHPAETLNDHHNIPAFSGGNGVGQYVRTPCLGVDLFQDNTAFISSSVLRT